MPTTAEITPLQLRQAQAIAADLLDSTALLFAVYTVARAYRSTPTGLAARFCVGGLALASADAIRPGGRYTGIKGLAEPGVAEAVTKRILKHHRPDRVDEQVRLALPELLRAVPDNSTLLYTLEHNRWPDLAIELRNIHASGSLRGHLATVLNSPEEHADTVLLQIREILAPVDLHAEISAVRNPTLASVLHHAAGVAIGPRHSRPRPTESPLSDTPAVAKATVPPVPSIHLVGDLA